MINDDCFVLVDDFGLDGHEKKMLYVEVVVCVGLWKKKKEEENNNNNMGLSIWTHGYLGLGWPFWNLYWSCPIWEWRVCFVEKIIKKKKKKEIWEYVEISKFV